MAALTNDQVESYRHDGHLFPVAALASAEAADLRRDLEGFEARWRGDPRLPEPFENYLRANLHIVCRAAATAAAHPAIVDAVESILGPDVLCWMVELIVKEPRSEKILTMHQDLTYWGLDLADQVVTAWVALCDVGLSNGAMRFVTGSHRRGQVAHNDTFGASNLLSRGQEVAVDHDPGDEVVVELEAGQISLHHGLTFHGSGPNPSDDRRLALAIRYLTPDVAQVVARRDYAMLVRGVNRTNNLMTVAPPRGDFDEASLRLFAEISRAQEQALARDAAQPLAYDRDAERRAGGQVLRATTTTPSTSAPGM